MSFINPEKVPVTVYRWDDEDAPRLDRSPNCVATIFKACLVTGYGSKQGAGWTMPYEDTNAGVKVLRPEVGVEQDFYLRLSNDTGREMTAQVYLNMTDVNTGELKLQCFYPFKYGWGGHTGKWLLIANGRSFWFLSEQFYSSYDSRKGGWFFCGDTGCNKNGQKAIYLHHTGGDWNDGDYRGSILTNTVNSSPTTIGQLYEPHYQQKLESYGRALFNGADALKSYPNSPSIIDEHYSPVYLFSERHIYPLIGIYVPSYGAKLENFNIHHIEQPCINFGMTANGLTNFSFALKYWSY